jgi:hypothetical protein
MGDVFAEVGIDDDVHAARAAHLPQHRQADHLGDAAAPSIGADQVLGADLVGFAGDAVLHDRGDAVVVLHEIHELGVETQRGAAAAGSLDQDRLQQVLRQVADPGRTCQIVIGLARRMIAPGIEPSELFAGDALAEHVIGH